MVFYAIAAIVVNCFELFTLCTEKGLVRKNKNKSKNRHRLWVLEAARKLHYGDRFLFLLFFGKKLYRTRDHWKRRRSSITAIVVIDVYIIYNIYITRSFWKICTGKGTIENGAEAPSRRSLWRKCSAAPTFFFHLKSLFLCVGICCLHIIYIYI